MLELARRALNWFKNKSTSIFDVFVNPIFSLIKTTKTNKKILSYLSEKDWSAEHAVINETFKEFEISKEAYIASLQRLSKKDLIEYQRPFGSGPFVKITQSGKNQLKPLRKRVLKYLLKNWIGLATLIFTIVGILFSAWIFNENQNETQVPFFKYRFDSDEQLFQVTGTDNIDPIKVDWYLVGKWFSDEEEYSLRKVNNLDKELSWFDIRDAYAQTLINAGQQWGKNVIECEFFLLTPNAIPAMVVVTYDTKNTTASSTDLLIITRMDTNRPNAQVIERNVTDSEEINSFFNENLWQVKHATQYIQENYNYSNEEYSGGIKRPNGQCDILMNQPIEGY